MCSPLVFWRRVADCFARDGSPFLARRRGLALATDRLFWRGVADLRSSTHRCVFGGLRRFAPNPPYGCGWAGAGLAIGGGETGVAVAAGIAGLRREMDRKGPRIGDALGYVACVSKHWCLAQMSDARCQRSEEHGAPFRPLSSDLCHLI